jgi:hypothetical protein
VIAVTENRAGKRGFSVPEILVAVLLVALVVPGVWSLFAYHRNGALRTAHEAEGLETVRTVGWLLAREVSGGRWGWEVREVGADSVVLRAFRGVATVLGNGGGEERLRVCYGGVRRPAPEKDSVLLMGPDGGWRAFDLEDRVSGGGSCTGVRRGEVEIWTLGRTPDLPDGSVLGRVFESGTYHLVEGAFRYRRGGGGRQPLTPERIHAGAFRRTGGGHLSWRVLLSRPGDVADTLAWEGASG